MNTDYTMVVCTRSVKNENIDRFMASYEKFIEPQGIRLILLSTGLGQFHNLNMAYRICDTKYIICADDDLEFIEPQINLVDNLNKFWNEHPDALGVAYAPSCKVVLECDETPMSNYNNFAFCCLSEDVLCKFEANYGWPFDENYEKSQCGDVDLIRTGRYYGHKWYGADFMCPIHHNKPNNSSEYLAYVKRNCAYMVRKFGCPTDADPEKENNWEAFENWLKGKP